VSTHDSEGPQDSIRRCFFAEFFIFRSDGQDPGRDNRGQN
jgi:hypothetical protein